jgi:hypothetical protein
LCISERRNRTRACYARRAAPTDNQNTPKAMNDFRGILVSQLQTKSNLIYTLSTALLSLSITLLNSNTTNNTKKLQLKN